MGRFSGVPIAKPWKTKLINFMPKDDHVLQSQQRLRPNLQLNLPRFSCLQVAGSTYYSICLTADGASAHIPLETG